MAQNPIRTAATATAGLVTGTLLEAVVKRFGYVLNTGESLGDLDFDVGEPPLVVISADTGFIYFYDATDATTADDGTTCLVSGNGLRYLASSGARPFMNSALTFAASPPGSPTVGDVHIVDTAATGGFSGHDDEIAFYTRRGWRFASPEIGLTLLVDSTGTNWQFTNSGWGGFPVELADGSVAPVALQFPGGLVVEDTLNTPPGSPTTGKFWIVGSVPTGAFVGRGADLAYWTGSAWAFLDPADGWAAYHKANGFEVFFTSGSWLGGAGSDMQEFSTAGGATWTKPARGTMAFVQCWGAGGSGGRSINSDGGGGGGGGAYAERWLTLASLGATEAVTVGAGGAARTSNLSGQAGGNSSFGSWLVGYGGGGGSGSTSSGGGGGGGGLGSAGTSVTGTAGGDGGTTGAAAAGGIAGAASTLGGGGGGASGATGASGGLSEFGGGGGGGGGNTNGGGNGGNSAWGGGGGGGGGDGSPPGTGGTSQRGGAGGAGATASNNATAGAQPGGGGGGSETGNSGKGGDGRVRVTVV